jgi:crotonobetainyl-CoA:carnitine CoA-transferase CaiB-like acyl-CoA transferase
LTFGERNPRLVFGRMTGWGQDGPLARTAGHDINYISIAGALHAIGRCGQAPMFHDLLNARQWRDERGVSQLDTGTAS